MTDLSALGLVSFGIVLTLATLGGFVLWVTRGFRVDLSGIRLVRTDTWNDRVLESPRRTPVDDEGTVTVSATDAGPRYPDGLFLKHDLAVDGDSERPPAVQHGQRTVARDE